MKRFIQNMQYQRRKLFYPRTAQGQRRAILNFVNKRSIEGATRDEIVVATGIPLQSVTWRVSELKRRNRIVQSSFFIRPTRLGRMAFVLFPQIGN